jgi:hypothetical protein
MNGIQNPCVDYLALDVDSGVRNLMAIGELVIADAGIPPLTWRGGCVSRPPTHPEYPSAHGCLTSASTGAIVARRVRP